MYISLADPRGQGGGDRDGLPPSIHFHAVFGRKINQITGLNLAPSVCIPTCIYQFLVTINLEKEKIRENLS